MERFWIVSCSRTGETRRFVTLSTWHFLADNPDRGQRRRCGSTWLRLVFSAAVLLAACSGLAISGADTNGPTILLRSGKDPAPSPVTDLMYFIPLISPVPVASGVSPGDTQAARIISCKREVAGRSFTTVCEMELDGGGWQRSVFDLGSTIRQHQRELEKGELLDHQLKSIEVRGAGTFAVEVKGAISNDVGTVTEVRMHFNAHGHVSPVWIDLCDLLQTNGDVHPTNEISARVDSLTFVRKAGPAKMAISISSLKQRDAGNGFWQNFKGRVEGATVNLFIPPLRVEEAGNQAMLDFGQALEDGAATFTFPKARNLRTEIAPLKLNAARQ